MKEKMKRRVLCGLVAGAMLLSLAGCGDTGNSPAPAGAESVQTTEAQGHNDKLTVETKFVDGKITSVEVLIHKESPSISDLALTEIPANIVKYQTVAVDAVAGATVTSTAIMEAVKTAIQNEGLDLNAFSQAADTSAEKEDDVEKTADVVVIGAGGAGLAAAVSAKQNGASVIVIEKMPKAGGNTVISGAAYNAVDPERQAKHDPPVEDSTDLHYQQTFEGGDSLAKPELVRVLVDNALPALEWTEELGMEYTDYIFTVLGGLWPRAHKPVKPLGTGFIETYLNFADKNDIEIMYNTTAESLIIDDDGAVIGVMAKGKTGNTVTLNANNGVILATGGFGANAEMREKYNEIWPSLSDLKTTNHPGATGDGLAMAEAAGANLIGLAHIQLLPMGDPETGSLSGNIEQAVENRIFVNKDGNRFVAEDERRDVMTKALFEQPDALMWTIVDSHSYPTGDTLNNFNESIDQLVEEGRAYKADTLEDLAAQIGVDPQNLVAAVEEFNKAVDAGGGDPMGRTLFQYKLDQGPYYAGLRAPTVHHTMGGIEINESAEVLAADGSVIKGLYAAGEVTGGIHGANRLGGNALADITVFGRIAGENAAKAKEENA